MAEWDAAYINDLPDSAFAVILPGGEKDDEGKTVPRSLRKLPHHNAVGELDMPHLRNAMSREPQSDMPEAMHAQAEGHLQAHMEATQTRADDVEPRVEAPEPGPAKNPEPEPPPPIDPSDGDVTTQPAISTEEAEATDVELSPVGDEKVTVAPLVTNEVASEIEVRDLSKREIGIRIVPWDTVVNTPQGLEEFKRGAFSHVDPTRVVLRMDHQNPAAGRGLTLEERADAAYMTFKVSATQRGDEILTLATDGVVTGASIGFRQIEGGTEIATRSGRRVSVHRKSDLREVSTTWIPTYEQALVQYVRSTEPNTEIAPMADQEAPVAGAVATADPKEDRIASLIDRLERRDQVAEAHERARQEMNDKFAERFEQLETRHRQDIQIPIPQPEKAPSVNKGEWIQMVVRLMTGERIPEVQMRALDDVITTDNAGVVPPAFLTELIGVIDSRRPFLSTTRRLPTPSSGMKLTVPVITQRPTAAVQTTEKTEVSSQKTIIGTEDFNAITIAGAGDLSIQIIKRSSPDFLNLWVELLAEAYAIEAEDQAILSLLNSIGGVGSATALDPNNLALGAAYVAAFDAIRRPPDTIWLSTQAVGEFIDAKASTTNQPMYPGLAASAVAAGGITGVISGLRPVHVPALDAHGAYAIVGPSSGFAWAEDGTYTLQVDVPAKAGRDVALVGIFWPAPWYPAAFTAYNVAS